MKTQLPSRNRLSTWTSSILKLAATTAVVLAVVSTQAANIAWVGYHPGDDMPTTAAANMGFTNAPDVGYTALLAANGHTVTRVVSLDNAPSALIDYLNSSFDLVILSRSGNSSHFTSAAEATAWDGMTVPMIVMNGYHSRSGQLGFFTGSSISDVSSNPVRLNVRDRSHPIFAGIALDSSTNMVNPYASFATFNNGFSNTVQRGISVATSPIAGGGKVLAAVGTAGDAVLDRLVIGEWFPPATMGNSSASVLNGHRLLFLSGSRQVSPVAEQGQGMFDLDPDGQQMFLNAVAYMIRGGTNNFPTIRVEAAADGSAGAAVPDQTVSAGSSITNYAIARDSSGNFLANIPVFWGLSNVTGQVLSSDLVPSPGYKSAVFLAHLAGSAQILAVGNATNLVPSGVITVVASAPIQVQVENQPDGSGTVLAAPNLAAGDIITAYAISRDVGGNFIANVATTWSLVNMLGSIVNGDLVPAGDGKSATFTANLPGWANIHVISAGLTSVDSGLIAVRRQLRWSGNGTDWDATTTTNWLMSDSATLTNFLAGDEVILDDTGQANPVVSLVGDLSPRSVQTAASSIGYTLGGAGKITGLGTLTNTGSATLTILTDNDYTGGTVVSGPVTLGNGGSTGTLGLGDVQVKAGGLLTFNRANSLTLSSRIYGTSAGTFSPMVINLGMVIVAGTGDNDYAAATVKSGATLVLAKTSSSSIHALGGSGGRLTVEPGGTVQLGGTGEDQIYNNISVTNNGVLDMQGLSEGIAGLYGAGVVDSTIFGTNSITLTVGNNTSPGDFAGVIRDTGFDGMTLTNKLALTKTGGGMQLLGGTNTYHGDTTMSGGTLKLTSTKAIPNGAGYGNVLVNGTLDLNGLSTTLNGLNGTGNVLNSSDTTAILTVGDNNASGTFNGVISSPFGALGLTKTGTGTLALNGVNTYLGDTLVNAGTLAGIGVIASPVSIAPTGTLSPAGSNALGTLTLSNNLTLAGTLWLEINRNGGAPVNDRLIGINQLVRGGTLEVANLGDPLQAGDTFPLFSAGSYSGVFAATNLPTLASNLKYDLTLLNTGILKVLANIPTYGTNLNFTHDGTTLTLSWPATHLGWSLQEQTDTLLGTNWVTIAGSETSTSFVVRIDPANRAVFYRMIYLAPELKTPGGGGSPSGFPSSSGRLSNHLLP